MGIKVPKIGAHDRVNGRLLLSDIGSSNVFDKLSDLPSANFFYRKAMDILLKIQRAGQSADDEDNLDLLNEATLEKELNLFPEWFFVFHLEWRINGYYEDLLKKTSKLLI
jgi:aminoglycoside/choline kinase family phosphotransferase